jgi:hypothetical protein
MKSLQIPEDWTATADNINALPHPLRRYIYGLQTNLDFAEIIRENAQLRQEIAMLREQCERLATTRKQAPSAYPSA